MRRPFPFFIFVAALVGLDLGSKWAIFHYLKMGDNCALIPDILNLTPAKNTGVAFSMFKDAGAFWFVLLSGVAIAAFVWIYYRSRQTASNLVIFSLGLLLSGAIGNMVDRALLGYVRDFIDFVPEIPLVGRWAIFNVADMCITVGVVLYFITEVIRPNPQTVKTSTDPSLLPVESVPSQKIES